MATGAHRLDEAGPEAVLQREDRVVAQPEAGDGKQREAQGPEDPGGAR